MPDDSSASVISSQIGYGNVAGFPYYKGIMTAPLSRQRLVLVVSIILKLPWHHEPKRSQSRPYHRFGPEDGTTKHDCRGEGTRGREAIRPTLSAREDWRVAVFAKLSSENAIGVMIG